MIGARARASRSVRARRLAAATATATVCSVLSLVALTPRVDASDGGTGSDGGPVTVDALSTATSTTQKNPDGSWTLKSYSGPINYKADDGTWQPIDNNWVDASGSTYAVRNAANSFTTKMPLHPSVDPVYFSANGGWVKMQMDEVEGNSMTIADDSAELSDVTNASSVSYQVVDSGLKESIQLDSPPSGSLRYQFHIETSPGLTARVNDVGGVDFTKDGQVAIAIPPGVMFESGDTSGEHTGGVSYSLNTTGDSSLTLTATPDHAWLNAPSRQYPVIIDPSLTNLPDSLDCTLTQGTPDTARCGDGVTYIKAGRSDSTHRWRGVMRFNMNSVPATADVSSAEAHLYLDKTQTTDTSVNADYNLFYAGKPFGYNATWNSAGNSGAGAWTGGDPGTAAATAKNFVGNTSGDKTFTGMESAVRSWITGANNGVVLKQVSEGTNQIIGFFSNSSDSANNGLRPYMNVTYTLPPTAPAGVTLSSCSGACDQDWLIANTLTPTITATSSDGDSSSLTYTFKLRDEATRTVFMTGTQTAVQGVPASWSVNQALANETQYELQISASDGVHLSSTEWIPLVTVKHINPEVPDGLGLTPCDSCTSLVSTSTMPVLAARVQDNDASAFIINSTFEVRNAATSQSVVTASGSEAESGDQTFYQLPTGLLQSGGNYEFRVTATGQSGLSSTSAWKAFSVAVSGPSEPTALTVSQCVTTTCGYLDTTSTSPTFSATNAGAVAADLLFEVQAPGGVVASGTANSVAAGSSGSWTVPPGTLNDGSSLIRVGSRVGSSTTWSGWQPMMFEPPTSAMSDWPAGVATAVDMTGTSAEIAEATATDTDPSPTSDLELPPQGTTGVGANSTDTALDSYGVDNLDTASMEQVVQTLSPIVYLDWYEPAMPIGAAKFINHSKLEWANDPKCYNKSSPVSPNPKRDDLKKGNYTHTSHHFDPVDLVCKAGSSWDSNDNGVRPYKAMDHQGMFLNLPDSWRSGAISNDRSGDVSSNLPVYYSYWKHHYVQYWFPYGESKVDLARRLGHHEGDWEQVSIKLDENNKPRAVEYGHHHTACVLKFGAAPKVTKHPMVWSTNHDHGNYPFNADLPWYEEDFVEGMTWRSSKNLMRATDTDWFGYTGGWGEVGSWEKSTGPEGPDGFKEAPNFGHDKCDMM